LSGFDNPIFVVSYTNVERSRVAARRDENTLGKTKPSHQYQLSHMSHP
jgi:hypothetical protein